jgi:hypothetical protein
VRLKWIIVGLCVGVPSLLAQANRKAEVFQEITPIVVNGILYTPAGNRVVALDPPTALVPSLLQVAWYSWEQPGTADSELLTPRQARNCG